MCAKIVEMATCRRFLTNTFLVCKLCLLLLLPFLLSILSLDELEGKRSICLFKNLFGIECYGCGITKAIIASVQFDFVRAFEYNKLVIIVVPLIVYLWIKEVIRCAKVLKG